MSNTDLSGRRVLVVEDSPNIKCVLERILLEFGADQVLLADDGFEAITKVESFGTRISGIVCDLELPRMDGPEFIHWLRASRQPDNPSSPSPVAAIASRYIARSPPGSRDCWSYRSSRPCWSNT